MMINVVSYRPHEHHNKRIVLAHDLRNAFLQREPLPRCCLSSPRPYTITHPRWHGPTSP